MSPMYAELPRDNQKLRCWRKLTSRVAVLSILLSISICGLVYKLHYVSVLKGLMAAIPGYRPDSERSTLQELPPLLKKMKDINIRRDGMAPQKNFNCSFSNSPPLQLAYEPLQWQPVSSTSTAKAYVFSAYFDRRWNPAVVMIIGLASEYTAFQDGDRQRLCRMWFSGEEKPWTVAADFRFVPETHGRQYAAVLYTCSASSMPYAVSLISTCSETASNLLKVVDTGSQHDSAINVQRTAGSRQYTVCVALLHSNYSDFRQLIETIEFNRMFGAQRVTLYHLSSSPEVRLILDSYERDGVVEIIPWDSLPLSSWDEADQASHGRRSMEVHYFGQVAAMNDCLYRNLFHSTFVLFSDVDEVAVPRDASGGDSWNHVLESATRDWSEDVPSGEGQFPRFPGVYMIRNVFYRPSAQQLVRGNSSLSSLNEWLKEDNYSSVEHTFREDYIFPYDIRSKYFAWTKALVMVGIHFPYEMLNSAVKTVYVSDQQCLLHHFRTSSEPGSNIIEDNWMNRFSRNTTKRIAERRNVILSYLTRKRKFSFGL